MNALTWGVVLGMSRCMRRLHISKPQSIRVDDSCGVGDRIVDLGGGGEGVIGQLRGALPHVIDPSRELQNRFRQPIKDEEIGRRA